MGWRIFRTTSALPGIGDAAGRRGVALAPVDGAGVVKAGDDGVVGHVRGEGSLGHPEEYLGLGFAFDDHLTGEVLLPASLQVGLARVKSFDVGGIATQLLLHCVDDGWVCG